MKFMLLLYGDPEAERGLSQDESEAIMKGHMAFAEHLRADGVHVYGEALGWPETARVLAPDGQVTQGPIADAHHQLGGLYVLDCEDEDTALAYAREVPASPGLHVEIRAVLDV